MNKQLLKNKHFLVAEDNVTNQIVVTRMIEFLGGTFDLAADGVEAIELYQAGKYDLALLDIEMPRKSGLEVIRHIRNDPRTAANFPVCALTAFVLKEHKLKITEAGASAIFSKPIMDVNEFGRTLASYFDTDLEDAQSHDIEINTNALGELKASLGLDITTELVENLVRDISQIKNDLAQLSKPVDRKTVHAKTHSLLSLAGMAGATSLVEITQNLNNDVENLDDDELLGAAHDIGSEIDKLLEYLKQWNKG